MMRKRIKLENEYLARMSSMGELKRAQRRVRRAIRGMECKMTADYDAAMDAFSYRNAIATGLSVFDRIQSVIRYAKHGYDTVRKPGCGCHDEF